MPAARVAAVRARCYRSSMRVVIALALSLAACGPSAAPVPSPADAPADEPVGICEAPAEETPELPAPTLPTPTLPAPTATAPVQTGDPLPASRTVDPGCPEAGAGVRRWLASRPHNPLAVVDGEGIRSATAACCAPWAQAGSRWGAVDAYGALVGEAEVVGGAGYDVTQCYELELEMRSGAAGVGVFVAADDGWQSPPSIAWAPSVGQRASLARTVAQIEGLLGAQASWAKHGPPMSPVEARTLYFEVPRHGEKGEVDGVERYAAVGGRALMVLRMEGERWALSYLDQRFSRVGVNRAYRPLAAFDLDGDGMPEVLYHEDAGDGWSDVVIGREPGWDHWQRRAESVGGSTA